MPRAKYNAGKARELYESGMTSREVAKELDCDQTNVGNLVRRAGGKMRSLSEAHMQFTATDCDRAREMYESGMLLEEVADVMKCSIGAAWKLVHRAGGILRPRGCPPKYDAVLARVLYEDGKSSRDVAKHLGCWHTTAQRLIASAGGQMRSRKEAGRPGSIKIQHSSQFSKHTRFEILERDGYTCLICGEYGNTVHHINHNKWDDREENLITMCSPCHTRWHARCRNKFEDEAIFSLQFLLGDMRGGACGQLHL